MTTRWVLGYIESLLTRPIFQPFVSVLSESVRGKGKISSGAGEGLLFDATGARSSYLLGTYCEEEQSFLVDNTSDGDVFYDIGAHVGFYTVIGARLVGEEGRVVAFEPIPEMANRCRENLSINGYKNSIVVGAAVGSRKGTSKFKIEDMRQGSKLSSEGDIEVKVVSLDRWIEENKEDCPDVMIVYEEGNEIEVLRGAIHTIKECRPDICVEVHGKGRRFSEYVDSNIKPLGYTVHRLGGGEIPSSSGTHFRAVLKPNGRAK